MNKIEIISKVENKYNIVELAGSIDEFFAIPSSVILADKINQFNLEKLNSINSTGIREWIKFHQKYQDIEFEFINCPKFFIDQVNMVKGFMPAKSKIISFYVPYFCESNDSEKNILYTLGKEFDGKVIRHPELVLDEKNIPMELDIVPERYFKFLGQL